MFTIPQTGLPDRYKAHILINARAEAVLQCLYEISLRSQWDKGARSLLRERS